MIQCYTYRGESSSYDDSSFEINKAVEVLNNFLKLNPKTHICSIIIQNDYIPTLTIYYIKK